MIRVSKKDFDLFVRDNNPEVFNQEAMSNWISDIKETLQKSELDELNDIEKGEIDNFKEELNSFTPVEVIAPNEDPLQKGLKYETFFIREQQVEWDKVEKSLDNDIEKSRSGIYKDTALNRKMGRVGVKFGGKKEAVEEDKESKKDDINSNKEGKNGEKEDDNEKKYTDKHLGSFYEDATDKQKSVVDAMIAGKSFEEIDKITEDMSPQKEVRFYENIANKLALFINDEYKNKPFGEFQEAIKKRVLEYAGK